MGTEEVVKVDGASHGDRGFMDIESGRNVLPDADVEQTEVDFSFV